MEREVISGRWQRHQQKDFIEFGALYCTTPREATIRSQKSPGIQCVPKISGGLKSLYKLY